MSRGVRSSDYGERLDWVELQHFILNVVFKMMPHRGLSLQIIHLSSNDGRTSAGIDVPEH